MACDLPSQAPGATPARRDPAPDERPSPSPAGLCDSCASQRRVPNTRGSVFSLCERSREDPTFPRYPRLPVLECRGHQRRPEG